MSISYFYVISVNYNGSEYYYLRNAQNDVVGLIDSAGQTVVQYKCDSWGKLTSTSGTLASSLGQDNPFRYRGYYYDTETSLYYLQSRYYDPEVGRFISADAVIITNNSVLGNNAFSYCYNNPQVYADSNGYSAEAVLGGQSCAKFVEIAAYIFGSMIASEVVITASSTIIGLELLVLLCTLTGSSAPYVPPADAVPAVKESVKTKSKSSSNSLTSAVSKTKSKIKSEKQKYEYWNAVYVEYGAGGTYIPTSGLTFKQLVIFVLMVMYLQNRL